MGPLMQLILSIVFFVVVFFVGTQIEKNHYNTLYGVNFMILIATDLDGTLFPNRQNAG